MYELLLYDIYIFAVICKIHNNLKEILYIITIRHIKTPRRRSIRGFYVDPEFFAKDPAKSRAYSESALKTGAFILEIPELLC